MVCTNALAKSNRKKGPPSVSARRTNRIVKRKICVVTGSRAEYGLLRRVLSGIRSSPKLELQLIVTGMHLSPEFGFTYKEVEADGFPISRKVETLLSSDSPIGVSKSIGLGIIGMSDALSELKPDLMILVGDRFEVFAAAVAALSARIPVGHIHGGEVTEGAYDDSIRHSITKLSHLHFAATDSYCKRIIQLGEEPQRVFLVGGLGVDAALNLKLLNKKELELSLGLTFSKKNLLVTFHPVTLEPDAAQRQFQELLLALEELNSTTLIFTMPNADNGGRALMSMLEEFVAVHPNAHVYKSLGQVRYLSCMKHVDGVVGNSSSGLIEAPAFRKGTVNIGNRQKGRERAKSIIDCDPERQSIKRAIRRLYSSEFVRTLRELQNPYGSGRASESIVRILENYSISDRLLKKKFYDVAFVQF
jgi:GDP/UDP-N,N'-diacetylbacillosamine 2-epimerase (hydrolysing)